MAQRPKDEVRAGIVAAAAEAFARVGFERATLAEIATEAGTSVGNVYKYFPGKEALFEAAVPSTVARDLEALLTRRVESLGAARDAVAALARGPYAEAAEALVVFALAHRPQILFLLRHGAGTEHERFADDVVRRLTRLAAAYAARAHGEVAMSAARRRALERIYRGFVAALADLLAEERSAALLREAIGLSTTYHLAGLGAFFAAAGEGAPRRGGPR